MRLAGRVTALERKAGVNAPCPDCQGRGHPGLTVSAGQKELSRSGGCPRCGRLSCLKQIILPEGSPDPFP